MNTVAQITELNPLLDFSGLPRFADIRPEHVAPALAALLGEARTHDRARRNCARIADLGFFCAAVVRRARPSRPRLDAGRTSERRRQYARAARGIQRNPAEDDGLPYRARAGRAPVRPLPGACCLARIRRRRSGPAPRCRQCAARFPAVGRRARGGAEGALQGDRGRARQSLARASPTMCSMPPTAFRFMSRTHRAWPACRPTSSRRRALRRNPMASRAGSSPCICRPTSRCCNTPTIGACAKRFTAPMRRGPANSANRNGTTGRWSTGSWRCAPKPPRCSATTATPKCRWFRRWRARRPR